MNTHQHRTTVGLLGLSTSILLSFFVANALLRECPLIIDEGYHVPQIQLLLEGKNERVEELTMPRTYHAIVAAIAHCHGSSTLSAIRATSAACSLMSVPLFYLCIRRLAPNEAIVRTLQFLFLPVLFHVHFLVYTDALAMVPTLCAVLAYLGKRYWISGAFAALGVMTRQTHIVCLAILFLTIYLDFYSWDIQFKHILEHCRRCWSYILGMIGFLCFCVLNGGVAIGDATMHPTHPIYTDNNFGFLLVFAVVFLPVNLSIVPQVFQFVRENRLLSGILLLTCINLFVVGFRGDHPYNIGRTDLMPRNYLIERLRESSLPRLAASTIASWSLLSIVTAPQLRPSCKVIYPLVAASLAFSWFISPRYYIPGLVMLLMFRSSSTKRVELVQVAWSFVIAFLFLLMTVNGKPIL